MLGVAAVSAGRSRWNTKPTPRQNFISGSAFLVIGTLQTLLSAIVGHHVLNLVVGISWLVVSAVSFASAVVQLRREQLRSAAESDYP
jgi:purine-cytosine permease-like protein